MTGTNLVLSFGDLSTPSGYRSRVLGAFRHLDPAAGLNPHLVVFDRHPEKLQQERPAEPLSVVSRRDVFALPRLIQPIHEGSPVRLVHAHNLYSAFLALRARKRFGYRVILDYHGRIPEEYVYLGKGGPGSRRVLESLERWCVTRSDAVVCVSQKLRDYVVERYPSVEDRTGVIPCCTDAAAFHWDPERREVTRRRLGFEGRLVCAHIGSFGEWYSPDRLVEVFENIRSRAANAHLVVMTGGEARARRTLSTRLPSGHFSVMSLPHDQVPEMLQAADLGMLLLNEAPNIRTASPTKFAEYLCCGLPVVISPGVGDFSEIVAVRTAGVVLADGETPPDDFLREVIHERPAVARRCREVGLDLDWSRYHGTFVNLVERTGVR